MLSFSYIYNNQLITLNSQVYTYVYDANNNLVNVTYPNDSTKTYLYENSNFPHHLNKALPVADSVRFATYAYKYNGFLPLTPSMATTTTLLFKKSHTEL